MISPGMSKAPRVLACVLCQSRKIKCDRNTPCSNCIKANIPCTPSTPAPPRKRRKPNQDLQQRLARCEELLSEYTTAPTSRPGSSPHDVSDHEEVWPRMAKLIIDDEGVKYTDSHVWANMHAELSAMREILDDDEADDGTTPNDDAGGTGIALVLSDSIQGSVDEFRPFPAHVFRLWQTFLERVNPLTKVIHVPTVQPQLVEAAANPASTPKNLEALLFAIYMVAVAALTEREVLEQLGMTKEAAYQRFSKGCQTALMRIGILKTYDLVVLQALVLYLFGLTGRFDRHSAWILNGVTIRVAQKMGLHRDGEALGLTPFETEMRRRIWWQIILIDCVYALMSGLGQSLLSRSWNTKPPRNINDADLYPTMTAIQPKEGPTDMIYCLLCYEVGKMMMVMPHPDSLMLVNEPAAAGSPAPEEVEKVRRQILELESNLGEILERYSDPSMGPVHRLAAEVPAMLIEKLKELVRSPREQPEWGTEIFNMRDNLFKTAVATCEADLRLFRVLEKQGPFVWFMLNHFQIEMLIYLASQLGGRVGGSMVDRAWACMEAQYRYHDELFAFSSKTHLALAVLVLRGWKAREEFLRQTTGAPPTAPGYIIKLMGLVPLDETRAGASAGSQRNAMMSTDMAATSTTLGADMAWDQMLGLGEMNGIDWNMFANGEAGEPYDLKLELQQGHDRWSADRRW